MYDALNLLHLISDKYPGLRGSLLLKHVIRGTALSIPQNSLKYFLTWKMYLTRFENHTKMHSVSHIKCAIPPVSLES